MRTGVLLVCGLLVGCLAGCGKHSGSGKDGSPDEKPELFLTPPGDGTIYLKKTLLVVVKLERRHFDGPVTITFDRLPPGVSVIKANENYKVPANQNSAEITLEALPTAELVKDHEVIVSAEGPKGVKASGRFRLTVMK